MPPVHFQPEHRTTLFILLKDFLLLADIRFNAKFSQYFQCRCNVRCKDPSSKCLAVAEDVTEVMCYCGLEGVVVEPNLPCSRDVPVIFVIILVIGCIVLAAIIGLLCMCLCKLLALRGRLCIILTPLCLDTQYQRKRMGMLRVKLQGANRFM